MSAPAEAPGAERPALPRRANRRQSLGAAALVLVALAVGRFVTDRLPTDELATRPFERHVSVGQAAHLRIGDVTVTQVRGAPEVSTTTQLLTTPGIWLVTDVRLTAASEALGISYAAVRSPDGRTWTAARGGSTCAAPLPGVPMACTVYLDVPPEVLPGAELVLRWNNIDLRNDDQAVIRLDDVTPGKVATWRTATEPILIPPSRTGA